MDPSRVPPEFGEAWTALYADRASMPWSELAFAEATRSLLGELLLRRRLRRALREVSGPVVIVHGQRDRLVDVRTSRAAVAANPRIELIELPGLGHTPHIEAPDVFVEVASAWLDRAAPPATVRSARVA